jgi:pimeloyl-ACP methyl ester carboxylesterase
VSVHFWQGECDNSTPLAMAQGMAARIPGATLSVLPGEGHLFIYGPLWRTVLKDLLFAVPRQS